MNNDIRDAYLWQEIIRIGFSPISSREIKNWLRNFMGSLSSFWEQSRSNQLPIVDSNGYRLFIDSPSKMGISFDVSVTNSTKFSAYFMCSNDTASEVIWLHDVDERYFSFPVKRILNSHGKRDTALKDLMVTERVLDGLIFHPRVHQHIESPVNNHEIRIGGGIENPFLFLFHLRFQLCPIPEKRNAEKRRLIRLFQDAIDKGRDSIPPQVILSQP